MQLKIIPFNNNYKIHKIEKSFSQIFKINPKLNSSFRFFKFCCFNDENEIVIIYNNPNSKYCLFYTQKVFDAIIYIIKEILNKRDIDLRIEYQLLLSVELLDSSNNLVYKLLEYISWPSGKKGYDYFMSFKNFTKELKELVFKKSLSLSDAYFFHEYFLKKYDILLKKLPEKSTFSERNQILRNLTEFAKKNKKNVNEVAKLLNNLENELNILDFTNNLRYPIRSKYKKSFISEMNKLSLDKGIKIHFDDTFEKEDYSMEIKFNNFSSLLKRLKQIQKSLEKSSSKENFVDFFDHDKLFKDNEE